MPTGRVFIAAHPRLCCDVGLLAGAVLGLGVEFGFYVVICVLRCALLLYFVFAVADGYAVSCDFIRCCVSFRSFLPSLLFGAGYGELVI